MHHWAKANNARYSAFVVSQIDEEQRSFLAEKVNHFDGTRVALGEAFRRESAISIELIIKAVIAQRAENARMENKEVPNVPMTHDVVKLWRNAKLPKLPDADQHRLVFVKSLLSWSSRYAAPKKNGAYAEEQAEFEPY